MAQVSVELQLKKFADKLTGPALKRATRRSMNRTIVSTRAQAAREIRKSVKLKASEIKGMLQVERVKGNLPVEKMRAVLNMFARGIPLIKLGARRKVVRTTRGKRIGATAMIEGKRQLVPGGFIATTKSGYTGVFARVGTERMPIQQLYSGEMEKLLSKKTFTNALNKYASAWFRKEFDREYKFEIGKAK